MGIANPATNDKLVANGCMSSLICHLTIYPTRYADAYRLRSDIQTFLKNYSGCKVIGCGRSCMELCTDIDVRVQSRRIAAQLLAALRGTYSACEIDAAVVV